MTLPRLEPPPPRHRRHGVRPRSGPVHFRRLTVATIVFAAAVIGISWLGAELVVRDLSERFVSGLIAQAREEAEALALVADPASIGEGERRGSVRGGANLPLDADVVLRPLLPDMFDPQGNPVDPVDGVVPRGPRRDPEDGEVGEPGEVAFERPPGRLPAILTREGWESRYLVDGELIGRDAIQQIGIRYPGGSRRILVRTIDQRDFDAGRLSDVQAERIVMEYPPASHPITITWRRELAGEPVELEAMLDATVIEEGVANLRARVVPKVLAGGGVIILLLGLNYAWTVHLISQARRTEAEANEQALLAQVGLLAAGLAHEIRNPLSAVQMNLQLLEEDLRENACEREEAAVADQVGLLGSTQKEIRRLGQLVSDFLAYARPAEPRLEARSMDDVVADCISLLRPMAEDRGIKIETSLGAGDDPVLVDEALVKQALMNVVLNAVEAVADRRGAVRIETRRAPTEVVVLVQDDGPGLPSDPEELFRVFHSTKRGGSGLGLPISRAIVERHGGTLTGRSRRRGGAEFALSIPPGGPE